MFAPFLFLNAMPTLLEDITSRDPHRIWSSSWGIVKLRDAFELDVLAAHLNEIKRETRNIELGGALASNNAVLEFALTKLEYVQNKSGCLCALYLRFDRFNPKEEQTAGNIRIVSVTGGETWSPTYICQCALCGRTFSVDEAEYHFTWWKWTDAPRK